MTFSDLNLSKPLLNALDDLGLTTPTAIQEKGFSVVMSGRDVIGIAQTGTGKTLAYLLPCLRLWSFSTEKHPQILIIVPTRELVVQVVDEIEKLTKYMSVSVAGVYGGTSLNTQADVVKKGVSVLVATPGRLLDLVLNGALKLRLVKRLIIDEIDEMLDLGFLPQIQRVIDLLPPKRQNLMFSATLTNQVEVIIDTFFNDPIRIEAAPVGTPLENITQEAFYLPNFNTKINLLKLLLEKEVDFCKVLVFTATKKLADEVFEQIEAHYPNKVGVIHSDKSQNNRFNSVIRFKEGQYRILIATDIIARGLDVSEVSHVINFDSPEEPENYIHRIGRTGRADRKGIAITFFTDADAEMRLLIESLMNYRIPVMELPSDLFISEKLTKDEMPKIQMKNIEPKPIRRENVGPAFHEKKEKNKKVNMKLTRDEQMKIKYKKPKTRGQKKK